ncbi:UNVERIFIED_CONTAM: hypothetical protein Sangu_3145800 [Sesamum angustifolium]|uniref:Uncharacterized protein n=1 Tax=Sesamum angustifolium TaxID=2727405 RepID=A0AAW2K042_9LAMI
MLPSLGSSSTTPTTIDDRTVSRPTHSDDAGPSSVTPAPEEVGQQSVVPAATPPPAPSPPRSTSQYINLDDAR